MVPGDDCTMSLSLLCRLITRGSLCS
jgi:hypothetical protein